MRQYFPGDGINSALVIREIRRAYGIEVALFKEGKIERADFKSCKERVLVRLMKEHGWDIQTRNLYSSTAALYIKWSRLGITKKLDPEVTKVATEARKFLLPNAELPLL